MLCFSLGSKNGIILILQKKLRRREIKPFSHSHTAGRWQSWDWILAIISVSHRQSMIVLSAKSVQGLSPIVLTATTWSRQQACLVGLGLPASTVIPSTESDPVCHSSAQSPLVASQPSQQSQVLTRWSPSPSLTSEPSGLLASGSLGPLSPPRPQGFTGLFPAWNVFLQASAICSAPLLQVLCSDVSQKGLPLCGRGNCLSLYRKSHTPITSWFYPPFNF